MSPFAEDEREFFCLESRNLSHLACLPAPEGCARCQLTQRPVSERDALLLGPRDLHAQSAAVQVLRDEGIPFRRSGSVLIVPAVAPETAILGRLARCLPLAVQQSMQACFFRGDLHETSRVISALIKSEPLTQMLARLEHEWVREALDSDWLFSFFHPIVTAQTGEVFAHEALIRARRPGSAETIGAGEIIDACTGLGLEHVLDQRARQSAIRHAAALNLADVLFFINFLPNTIYDPEICLRTTMEAAAEHAMPLSRLVFEVVETENIPDMRRLMRILDYYRAEGIGTAVDDMGAGFATMSYLEALRPDYVKIDRELVQRAAVHTADRHKLDSIVDRAKELDIKVIAEGIETHAQWDVCRRSGADYLQGFLFARPANPPATVHTDVFAERLQEAA